MKAGNASLEGGYYLSPVRLAALCRREGMPLEKAVQCQWMLVGKRLICAAFDIIDKLMEVRASRSRFL